MQIHRGMWVQENLQNKMSYSTQYDRQKTKNMHINTKKNNPQLQMISTKFLDIGQYQNVS